MKDTAPVEYLTKRAMAVMTASPEDRPSCVGAHTFMLVRISDRGNRWRCERCLRYLDAPSTSSGPQGSLF